MYQIAHPLLECDEVTRTQHIHAWDGYTGTDRMNCAFYIIYRTQMIDPVAPRHTSVPEGGSHARLLTSGVSYVRLVCSMHGQVG